MDMDVCIWLYGWMDIDVRSLFLPNNFHDVRIAFRPNKYLPELRCSMVWAVIVLT